MDNLGVSLSDYGGLFDPNNVTADQLSELSKALSAGALTGGQTVGQTNQSGAPLKVESLEQTLKHLEFQESDIVFWKLINKAPAYNTVEEFNQLLSYGADRGGFQNEGELPAEEDSVYRRMSEQVKFLGVTKSVTHPMQLVRTQPSVGSIIQREIKNGTLWIMRKADRALAFGDASYVPQEFNGLYAQQRNSFADFATYMSSEQVIDLRGAALTEAVLMDASNTVINNHGYADTLIGPPVVISDFAKNFLDRQRIYIGQGTGVTSATVGQALNDVQTQFGKIQLKYDKFLQAGKPKLQSTPADSSNAPTAVTVPGSGAVVAAADAASKFGASDAGNYYYAVAAQNRYGESSLAILNSSAASAVAAGEGVSLTFTDGGGAYPATSYVIYRSAKNPTGALSTVEFFPLFTVSTSQLTSGYDGGAAGKVRDRNRFLTGCQQAIFIENSTDVYEFKQLAPLMKMDLATLAPATRFMILLYGTPQLYAPKKMVRFINIGRQIA